MKVERIIISFLEQQKDQSPEYAAVVQSLAQQSLPKYEDCLQTDGISTYRNVVERSSDVDEELCRRIGAQLAELGDQFERDQLINQEVVQGLVNDILDKSLTEDRFQTAVQSIIKNVPAGIEQEKASLAVALLLTSKIGKSIPSLLQSCFSTATTFISRNFTTYIENMAEQR